MATDTARPHGPTLNLAEIEPFVLGHATVDPGRRNISWSDRRRVELEPRVMKVLVTLAQADGHVVSRDRLTELCWDGRIVSDDAINRCVQAIRRVASQIDPQPFHIETTARVGYSLIAEPGDATPSHGFSLAARAGKHRLPPRRRPMRVLSIGAVTLGVATMATMLPTRGENPMTRIAVTADDTAEAAFARDLKVDLNQFAGGTLTDVSLVDSPADSDFVVRMSARPEGAAMHASATLSDGRSKDLLWSATASAPGGAAASVRGQLAAKLGNLFDCASKMSGKGGRTLDTASKRLFLKACTHMDDIADEQDIDLLRKLTADAPSFAAGWSYLALAEAERLTILDNMGDGAPAERELLRRRSAAALERAQALNPDLGTNFVAAALLKPAPDWAGRLTALEAGIARDPDEYALYEIESSTLASVGLASEALSSASRAADLKPFSVNARAALIWALVHNGEIARARAELSNSEKLWPQADELTSVRFSIELRYGDPRAAKQMIDAGLQLGSVGCGQDLMMQARLAPTASNIADLIHYAKVETRKMPDAAPQRLLALAQFDATDDAYSMLQQPGAAAALQRASEILFRPQFESFRRDPRFPFLAARLGLLRFWKASGRWPDFCSDPRLTYDCKAEASRLVGTKMIARSSPAVAAEPQAA